MQIHVPRLHVGVLGGTGPAGSGLAIRLASVGLEVTIGSRTKDRAQQTAEALCARYDVTAEEAERDVEEFLRQLAEIDAVESREAAA